MTIEPCSVFTTPTVEGAVSRALILASPPDLALEVGCEGGHWVRVLCDAGWRVHATDVDADAIAICRERNPNAECFLVSPSDTKLPEEDLAAKLIMCIEVAPVVSSNWFIPECARVLKPGGWVVVVYYNSLSLRGWVHRLKCLLRGNPKTAIINRSRITNIAASG